MVTTTNSEGHAAAREQLSALADGELGEAQVSLACMHWRSDAALRSSWHAYQLIGDVLRSEDLGTAPGRDAGFLAALRSRLADEPVVLAPLAVAAETSVLAERRVRWSWRAPLAVAAGFVAVAGVVLVTRTPGAGPEAPALARAAAPAGSVVAASTSTAALPSPAVADSRALIDRGQLIRDVRLDRYLSAHKEFAGSSALGVPSGFLRNATAEAVER